MDKIYDVVIIGAGPAGMSAAIYAQRAGLETILIEAAYVSGGQIVNTYEVDNYPGMPGLSGMELAMKFQEHAEKTGIELVYQEVTGIGDNGSVKTVSTVERQYTTKTIIIATGARHRILGIPGEEKLTGMGVSYCATCDGAFFRDKTVAVIGGGDVAVEDAIFLARASKKVYLIHRRDELRAAKSLQEKLLSLENVEVLWSHTPQQIIGEDHVKALLIKELKSNTDQELSVDGVFVAVGILPNTELFKGIVDTDEGAYIRAGEGCKTNVPGIYAAGDLRTKALRQIITAAADGANAITSVQEYLLEV